MGLRCSGIVAPSLSIEPNSSSCRQNETKKRDRDSVTTCHPEDGRKSPSTQTGGSSPYGRVELVQQDWFSTTNGSFPSSETLSFPKGSRQSWTQKTLGWSVWIGYKGGHLPANAYNRLKGYGSETR